MKQAVHSEAFSVCVCVCCVCVCVRACVYCAFKTEKEQNDLNSWVSPSLLQGLNIEPCHVMKIR